MSGDSETGGAGRLPRLQLDELLEELERRISAVRGTQDRVHSLLEAVLSIGRGLDLPQVLQQIVEAAVVLVDAEYGALGVVGEQEELSEFLPVGMTGKQVESIGALPSGHGILGQLIRHPEPLRLEDLAQHPASYGFPANHPPMHSFLGVPIRVRDEVFGNFYLTEKRGAKEFDAEDEAVLSTLAVAAGVAIENAQLYEETRRRERWSAASSEVTSSLLSGDPRGEVLELIIDHAKEIVAADLGVIAVPVEGTDGLRTALASGVGSRAHSGIVLPRQDSFMGAVFASGKPIVSTDIQNDSRVADAPAPWAGLGPAIAVPMGTGAGVRGVLMVARSAGRQPFIEIETTPLTGFAGQAALAMEVAERRRDAEQIALLEERDRIARDLHDLAIQRLFATGMTLQSAQRFAQHPEVVDRLMRAVDDLDATIKIIRSSIFGLRSAASSAEGGGLRARVATTVGEAAAMLGFTPALQTEGLVDTNVPPAVAEQVTAVLKEALSNVARHAKATGVRIRLAVEAGQLLLTVTDDGCGIPRGARRSGLRNLAERAEGLGGEMVLDVPPEGSGTRLTWRVPLIGSHVQSP